MDVVRNPAAPQAAPELRQITVYFCDLVGSTPLAQAMDAEDYHDLIQEYQGTVGDIIRQYDGSVARTFGDGILAFFGHPVAHEDDAQRAILAALDAVQAMQRANAARAGQPPLAIRVGIHTGPAVISRAAAGDGTEVQAVGDSVNLAARLQGFAEPDTAVISATTLKLVLGLFLTRDLGEQSLKGIQQPVRVHQVLGPSGARSRLEAAGQLTPFVGRRRELDFLREHWARVQAGAGQTVLLSAEPGVGKSRLLMALREQTARVAPWLECRCSPLARNTALSPFLDLLNRSLRTPRDADHAVRLDALEQALAHSGVDPAEGVPLLAPLLNMKLSGKFAPGELGPELRRRKTLNVLSGWCLGQARAAPAVLVVEDLHWADPSTVELLGMLAEQVPLRPMLLLPSARPEFSAGWAGHPFSLLALDPLEGDETAAIVDSITGQRALPGPVRERLLRQAGGVPLFLEEATRALLESGQLVERDGRLELVGSLERLSIPATLQDTLMARLDRLGPARGLIQGCAVIGREVPLQLLAHVVEIDAGPLAEQMRALTQSQLLHVHGAGDGAKYVFRHALIQDAAYQSIWKKTRAAMHARVARAIEEHLPQWAKAAPEMLALHWEGAGEARRAIDYRKAAGRLAARSSFTEATEHAQKALRLLAALPEGEERLGLELDVNLTLSDIVSAAGVVGGLANPDAIYTRVRELCAQVKDPVLVGRALASSWQVHYQRCDFGTTLAMGAQLLELGRQTQRVGLEIVGWIARGLAHLNRGEQRDAMDCARRATALTDPGRQSAETRVAYDLVLPRQYIEIVALALMGCPDQALLVARDMVARPDAVQNPFLVLFSRCKARAVDLFRRDWSAIRASVPAILQLAEQVGDQDQHSDLRWQYAVATCSLGQFDEGLALYREVIDHENRWQAPHWHSFIHGAVADALLRAGRLDEARTALGAGMEVMARHDERFWEADLHRVQGELLRAAGAGAADVEAAFDRALTVARAQGARLLELRAATGAAGFWRDRGRRDDARALLGPVRGAFSEGLGLEDLRAADAVLAGL